jgi:hypothetical protein
MAFNKIHAAQALVSLAADYQLMPFIHCVSTLLYLAIDTFFKYTELVFILGVLDLVLLW